MTISVFPQVNVAIRTSLQSLREKIEQLRELLLRAVSTRQMYLYQHPCPLGCGHSGKSAAFLLSRALGFPLIPFARDFVTRTFSVLLVVIFMAAAAQGGQGTSGVLGENLALVTSVSPGLRGA